MIFAITFIIGILIILIFLSKSDDFNLSSKTIDNFIKWAEDHHNSENFKIIVNKNIIKSISNSLEIEFDAKNGKGLYHDKALNKIYHIVYLKNKFYILED